MSRLFGTDGIRGRVGEGLDAPLAHAVGRALGTFLSETLTRPLVLIGHDTRLSCDMLTSALAAGLAASGADTALLGVLPTPAVSRLVTLRGAAAGVVVSASHNPAEYNGIKIFDKDGTKLSDEGEARLEALLADPAATVSAPPAALGRVTWDATAAPEYIAALAATVPHPLTPLALGVDCANGAAARIAPPLFERLGLAPRWLGIHPDGTNINKECGSTSLGRLGTLVRREGLSVGLAFDGDADRCLLVDETGATVDGDAILAMLALDRRRRGLPGSGAVVGTVMSNLGLRRLLEGEGVAFHAAPVGDRFVAELMQKTGASLGGEASGHVILREQAATGDGLQTALAVLSLMERTKQPLSALAAVLSRYPSATVNLPLAPTAAAAVAAGALAPLTEALTARLGSRGRLVLRPSGTEPLLRITVEADTRPLVDEVLELASKEATRVLETL